MIDLYTAPTVNGYRAAIALEEAGLAWRLHRINFRAGEQRSSEFLRINPAGKIPVIIDPEGRGAGPIVLAQSGAILVYAAEKSGSMLPSDPQRRYQAWQWFMQAMTDVQASSSSIFLNQGKAPVSERSNVEFYEGRMIDFLGYCDARLSAVEYLAEEFSIADVALYVLVAWRQELVLRARSLSHLQRWAGQVGARPAIRRAYSTVGVETAPASASLRG